MPIAKAKKAKKAKKARFYIGGIFNIKSPVHKKLIDALGRNRKPTAKRGSKKVARPGK